MSLLERTKLDVRGITHFGLARPWHGRPRSRFCARNACCHVSHRDLFQTHSDRRAAPPGRFFRGPGFPLGKRAGPERYTRLTWREGEVGDDAPDGPDVRAIEEDSSAADRASHAAAPPALHRAYFRQRPRCGYRDVLERSS